MTKEQLIDLQRKKAEMEADLVNLNSQINESFMELFPAVSLQSKLEELKQDPFNNVEEIAYIEKRISEPSEPTEYNDKEYWKDLLCQHGFKKKGENLYFAGDVRAIEKDLDVADPFYDHKVGALRQCMQDEQEYS